MKRIFFLFVLGSMLVSFNKSAPKVLILIKEGSPQLEYMLTNEVGRMTQIISESGFKVVVATMSGEILSAGPVTIKPDLKLAEVNIDEYDGFIIPCMTVDMQDPEIVSFVKATAEKEKPIAAQLGSVYLLAKAGILNGKKYAFMEDQSANPDFKGATYGGYGVVTDGFIITSGTCPYMAKQSGREDCTPALTNALVEVIKARS